MVQCSRCRQEVDETTRKTCPACLTPLPALSAASAAPNPATAPLTTAASSIPVVAPKAQAPAPVPMYPGAAPMSPPYAPSGQPGYAPAGQPGYAPPGQPGYAPPQNGGPYMPPPGAGAPPYANYNVPPGSYPQPPYAGNYPPAAPPATKERKSSGVSFGSGGFPWWRLCFIFAAIARGGYWASHSNTTTPSYSPASYSSPSGFSSNYQSTPLAPTMPAATPAWNNNGMNRVNTYTPPPPTFPTYQPPAIPAPHFSSGPSGFGGSHFSPPTMPIPRFGPSGHFGR